MKHEKDAYQVDPDQMEEFVSVSSSTDCTGLIPSMVMNESEAEAYDQLYDIHQPKPPRNASKPIPERSHHSGNQSKKKA